MEFIITAISDIGISRKVNQDALFASKMKTSAGNIAFAVMCDGMGGLSQGEIASASVVNAFKEWYHKSLPLLVNDLLSEKTIVEQWTYAVQEINRRIRKYGEQNNSRLGSTATVLLLSESRYYLMNIGDTRAYLLTNEVDQLTVDHTLVEQQIRLGKLTREQAESSSIRSVITRCVGVTEEVYPDFFFGTVDKGAVYLLCTDGFRHKITEAEMNRELSPGVPKNSVELQQKLSNLIELNKYRREHDNISAIAIETEDPDLFISDDYLEEDDDDVTIELPDEGFVSDDFSFSFQEEVTLINTDIIL